MTVVATFVVGLQQRGEIVEIALVQRFEDVLTLNRHAAGVQGNVFSTNSG